MALTPAQRRKLTREGWSRRDLRELDDVLSDEDEGDEDEEVTVLRGKAATSFLAKLGFDGDDGDEDEDEDEAPRRKRSARKKTGTEDAAGGDEDEGDEDEDEDEERSSDEQPPTGPRWFRG